MPWHVVHEHSECPSSRPWAVVKDDDGEVEGCHPSRTAANRQLAALNASETNKAEDREDRWTWPAGGVRVSNLPPERQQAYDERRRRLLGD